MLEDRSVTAWIAGLKSGDSAAAGKVWRRYVDRLIRLARGELGSRPMRVSDEEDVALSTFKDFLQGLEEGRFANLHDRDDLWQVLVMLTERKAVAQRRREQAQKRGGGQVRGESVFAAADADNSQHPGLAQWADEEPTPTFAVSRQLKNCAVPLRARETIFNAKWPWASWPATLTRKWQIDWGSVCVRSSSN